MPATVQKAAPAFTADAVMPDGSFKTISLADYKGAHRSQSHLCLPRPEQM